MLAWVDVSGTAATSEIQMEDPLTYTQRLKLGAIGVRKDCADQARRLAVQAALANDMSLCEMMHAEADKHEAAIVDAIRDMALADYLCGGFDYQLTDRTNASSRSLVPRSRAPLSS